MQVCKFDFETLLYSIGFYEDAGMLSNFNEADNNSLIFYNNSHYSPYLRNICLYTSFHLRDKQYLKV